MTERANAPNPVYVVAVNAVCHDFGKQECVVHLSQSYQADGTYCRYYILHVEDGRNTLIPLIQHGLETSDSPLPFQTSDFAGTVRVQQIIDFSFDVGELYTSSIVVEMSLAVLRPDETYAVRGCQSRKGDVDVVVELRGWS